MAITRSAVRSTRRQSIQIGSERPCSEYVMKRAQVRPQMHRNLCKSKRELDGHHALCGALDTAPIDSDRIRTAMFGVCHEARASASTDAQKSVQIEKRTRWPSRALRCARHGANRFLRIASTAAHA